MIGGESFISIQDGPATIYPVNNPTVFEYILFQGNYKCNGSLDHTEEISKEGRDYLLQNSEHYDNNNSRVVPLIIKLLNLLPCIPQNNISLIN